ncbi:GDSL esterase/lipase EXL1-like [Quercus suber]|uniref:GDSL esterase/lipase EXL1-like n=1 Tax=Quercus suber TaxID=58331 RepID=UPI0032DE5DEB
MEAVLKTTKSFHFLYSFILNSKLLKESQEENSRAMLHLKVEHFSLSTKFFFLYFVFAVLCSSEAVIQIPNNETIPAVIMFGDSIVDTGNNNGLTSVVKCDFPPYGRDFNGGMLTGRFSNGKVPSDFLVEELGIKDLLPAYRDPSLQPKDLLTGVSFASGGTGYDPLTPKIVEFLFLWFKSIIDSRVRCE